MDDRASEHVSLQPLHRMQVDDGAAMDLNELHRIQPMRQFPKRARITWRPSAVTTSVYFSPAWKYRISATDSTRVVFPAPVWTIPSRDGFGCSSQLEQRDEIRPHSRRLLKLQHTLREPALRNGFHEIVHRGGFEAATAYSSYAVTKTIRVLVAAAGYFEPVQPGHADVQEGELRGSGGAVPPPPAIRHSRRQRLSQASSV